MIKSKAGKMNMIKRVLFFIISGLIIFTFTSPVVLNAFSPESELFSEAESRFFSKNYAAALQTYDRFLKKYPLSDLIPDVYYRKALCLFRLQRYQEAKGLFLAVEKRYRTTRYIDYLPFWSGVCSFQLKDYKDAVNKFTKFIEDSEDYDYLTQAYLYRALSEVAMEDLSSSRSTLDELFVLKGYSGVTPQESILYTYVLLKLKLYQKIIYYHQKVEVENYPQKEREKALLHRAEAFYHTGEIEKAIDIYRRLLDASDKDAVSISYRRLYTIAQQREDLRWMETLIQKAETHFSSSPEILSEFWLRIGIESLRQDKLQLAQHFLIKVWNLWLDRKVKELTQAVPLALSYTFINLNRSGEAVAVLERYLEVYPRSEMVLFRLCGVLMEIKEYRRAADCLAKYLDFFPDGKNNRDALYFLSYSLYSMGKYGEALKNCEKLFIEENGKRFTDEALKLKVTLLKKLNRLQEAVSAMYIYINRNPQDTSSRVDLLKLLYLIKDYRKVIDESSFIVDKEELLNNQHYKIALIYYLRGLAFISLKNYSDGLLCLEKVLSYLPFETEGKEELFSSATFYKGWAHYRLNRFSEAVESFNYLIKNYPEDEFVQRATFLTAWCYFSLNKYQKALQYFSRIAEKEVELQHRALYLKAKCFVNIEREDEALPLFRKIFTEFPSSLYADDALFEYSTILGKQGKVKEACDLYYRLFSKYPSSTLSEEALYRRGELYYNHQMFQEAVESFRRYRNSFPQGRLMDASLHWEAVSDFEIGEVSEALSLWETIIETYENSPFRPDSLRRAAEIYASRGEYQKALNTYSRLIEEYPDFSEAVDAQLNAEEMRYVLFGMNRKEAHLTALISIEGGVKTFRGREAMLELARFYIFEKDEKIERAFQMLSQVLDYDDRMSAAKAQFLLGEYYNKKQDYLSAARAFFRASILNPGEPDFTAQSIYRSAEMMKREGRMGDVKELVKRLEESFPGSEWVIKGKELLENK